MGRRRSFPALGSIELKVQTIVSFRSKYFALRKLMTELLCFPEKSFHKPNFWWLSSRLTKPDIWKGLSGGFVCDGFELRRAPKGREERERRGGRKRLLLIQMSLLRGECLGFSYSFIFKSRAWAFLTMEKHFSPHFILCMSLFFCWAQAALLAARL